MREMRAGQSYRYLPTASRCTRTCFFLLAFLVLLMVAVAGAECGETETGPITDFTYATVPSETAPIMVNFYSTSEGGRTKEGRLADPVESYLWRFGDGDTSTESNPLHTYAIGSARHDAADQPFMVSLTVSTECGRSNTTTQNVPVYCLDQKAGFKTIGPAAEGPYTAPVALYIRDTSLHVADGVTTYHYTLWDAAKTRLFKDSMEKDPVIIISSSGSFVLRQEVFKSCSNASSASAWMEKQIEVTGSGITGEPMVPLRTVTPSLQAPAASVTQPATVLSSASIPVSVSPSLQPPAAPPGTGTLSVTSSPAGAEVFVNDVMLGVSPVVIPGLAPGSYNLRVQKSGYPGKTVRVEIGDGRITEYAAALEEESGGTMAVPLITAIFVLAAGAGAAWWYRKRKPPAVPDWNNP